MNEQEVYAWLGALRNEIGDKAWLNVGVGIGSTPEKPVNWSLYPLGILQSVNLYGYSATFTDALGDMMRAWTEYRDTHNEALIDKIALALITTYAKHGECTDVQLRVECGLDQDTIERLAPLAEERANRLAMNMPFHITFTDLRDNGAPIDE
jgi:hypothetical protein